MEWKLDSIAAGLTRTVSNLEAFRLKGSERFEKEPAPRARQLSRDERTALERHFLALDTDDRRLRFGNPLGDAAVRAYVDNIDFDRDALFGVFAAGLLVGVAHLAYGDKQAELGLSVLSGYRNRRCGSALLARASLRARNWGVDRLFMHCLRENDAIIHLARKLGMNIAREAGEASAWLQLPPADVSSLSGDLHAGVAPIERAFACS